MNSYIIGQIKRIIFRGDNNYIIGVIKIKDTSNDLEEYKLREVTFTGYFVDLNDIDNYQCMVSLLNMLDMGHNLNLVSMRD